MRDSCQPLPPRGRGTWRPRNGDNGVTWIYDAVDDKREQDDAGAEGPDAHALVEVAHLQIVQAEVGGELSAAEVHSVEERVGGGDESDEEAPKEDS